MWWACANMSRTALIALAFVSVLAFPTAGLAAHSITSTNGSSPTLTVTAESDGSSIDISACTAFRTGCAGGDFKISSFEAFDVLPPGCTDPSTNLTEIDCDPEPASVVFNGSANFDRMTAGCGVFGGPYSLTWRGNAGNDVVSGCGGDYDGGTGDDDITGGGVLRGGAGNDSLSGTVTILFLGGLGVDLQGGDGRDTLRGTANNDTLDGGADNDVLDAGAGNDSLKGAAGRDLLLPGSGTDATIQGGDGIDTVSYENSPSDQGLSISLNNAADDGAPNEKDNISGDIENITGSPSPDNITGSDGVNVIEGDAGNDTINPLKGNDFVSAGSGDDVVATRDGVIDAIDCGEGNDKLVSDAFDSVANCETVEASRELMPDIDNDGVPAPADCDDRDSRRRPGLPDKPGNGIDEDCSGRDAPYIRIVTGTQTLFAAGATTQVRRFNLIDVPAGAKIEVRCKRGKKSCFKARRTSSPKGAGTLNLRSKLKLGRLRLKPGSLLELRITNTDSIGKVVQYPVKRGTVPVSRLRCLPPGDRKPRRC
jgi:hypothetical protein